MRLCICIMTSFAHKWSEKMPPQVQNYFLLWFFFFKFTRWINMMKLPLSINQELVLLVASNPLSESHQLIHGIFNFEKYILFFFQVWVANYCLIVYRTTRRTTEIFSVVQDSLPAHAQILKSIQFPTHGEFPFYFSLVFSFTKYLPDFSPGFI